MKIKELRPGMEKIDLKVKVFGLKDPREVTTNYGITHIIVDGEVGDETGRLDLAVWNEFIEGLKFIDIGDEVELKGCFITSFKGVLSINVGRGSEITKSTRGMT